MVGTCSEYAVHALEDVLFKFSLVYEVKMQSCLLSKSKRQTESLALSEQVLAGVWGLAGVSRGLGVSIEQAGLVAYTNHTFERSFLAVLSVQKNSPQLERLQRAHKTFYCKVKVK